MTTKAVRYLVIPAAGLGTRMRTIDPDLPKELLLLGGKPVIRYALEEGIDAGVERIIVIIRKGKERLREAFADAPMPVDFLYQNLPCGEADALALAEPLTGNNPLAILYPDNIYLPAPGALKLLTQAWRPQQAGLIGLTASAEPQDLIGIGNAGRVDLEPAASGLYRIVKQHPKGPGQFIPRFKGEMRAGGIWIAGPGFFDALLQTREEVPPGSEFTDAPVREQLIRRGFFGLPLPGRIFDAGNPDGYRHCQTALFGISNVECRRECSSA
ncbi:MAG: NTP transferase domain-containing protein [Gammaproteobacteria bacterium]|nr:NTP transferase domain-containing protein [Gammaproteobacteria bacterium]